MLVVRVFYASGSKGKSVRADGKGGLLARGWYVRKGDSPLIGPLKSRRAAEEAAGKD